MCEIWGDLQNGPFSGVIDFRRIEPLTEITDLDTPLSELSDTGSISFTFDHFIYVKVICGNRPFLFRTLKMTK